MLLLTHHGPAEAGHDVRHTGAISELDFATVRSILACRPVGVSRANKGTVWAETTVTHGGTEKRRIRFKETSSISVSPFLRVHPFPPSPPLPSVSTTSCDEA